MGSYTRREFLEYMSMAAVPLIVPQYAIPELPPPPTFLPPKDPDQGIKRNPKLGIRNNTPELMEWVSKLGASWVRIAGDRETFNTDPEVKRAIESAFRQKLDILYTYNPQRLLSLSQTRDHIDRFLNHLYLDAIELGNEADNDIIKFWQNQDLKTLAVFSLAASSQIFESRPYIRVGLGALVDRDKLEEFLAHLKNPDFTLLPDWSYLSRHEKANLGALWFNPKRYFYGVHAYHEKEDVKNRVTRTKEILNGVGLHTPEIWMTEVGTQKNKLDVLDMLDVFFAMGGEKAFIHELLNAEGFGFIDYDEINKEVYPHYLNISRVRLWSQQYR